MIGTRVQFECNSDILEGTVMDKIRVPHIGNEYNIDYYVIVDRTDKVWVVSPNRIQKLLKSEK